MKKLIITIISICCFTIHSTIQSPSQIETITQIDSKQERSFSANLNTAKVSKGISRTMTRSISEDIKKDPLLSQIIISDKSITKEIKYYTKTTNLNDYFISNKIHYID